MSAESNLQTVEAIYTAFGEGGVEKILALLSDDIDWSADADSGAAPWYGRRTSKDDVAGFFTAMGRSMEVHEFSTLAVAATDKEVMSFIRFEVTMKSTGKSAAMNLHHYFGFDEDGKVNFYRGSEDTAQTIASLS